MAIPGVCDGTGPNCQRDQNSDTGGRDQSGPIPNQGTKGSRDQGIKEDGKCIFLM